MKKSIFTLLAFILCLLGIQMALGIPELNAIRGYKTPSMNKFADEGMRFARVYTEPSCTPTRVAFMTARRDELDLEYIHSFAGRVREIFPFCPTAREGLIAEHACRKYSGRVGRSAAAKALDEEAVRLAVNAHVRHAETDYDELLLNGIERRAARDKVYSKVYRILGRWEHGGSQD